MKHTKNYCYKHYLFLHFLTLTLFIPVTNSYSQENEAIKKEIQKIIKYETNIDYKETPGFVVGMIDHEQQYHFSFGQKSLNDPTSFSVNDVFEWGGTTKILTALILEKIKSKYLLDFTASINDYLPVKNESFKSCSIQKLLTHTSGLPKYIPGWGAIEDNPNDPFSGLDENKLTEFYASYQLIASADQPYLYSHINYLLLGWILKEVTGSDLVDLTKEYLNIDINQTVNSAAYNKSMKEVKPWNSGLFFPSLGARADLYSFIHLAKFLLAHKSEDVKGLYTVTPIKVRNQKGEVANGLQVISLPKSNKMFFHVGRTEGHYSFIGLIPKTNTAVVILANSSIGADLLGVNILRMMNENWNRKN